MSSCNPYTISLTPTRVPNFVACYPCGCESDSSPCIFTAQTTLVGFQPHPFDWTTIGANVNDLIIVEGNAIPLVCITVYGQNVVVPRTNRDATHVYAACSKWELVKAQNCDISQNLPTGSFDVVVFDWRTIANAEGGSVITIGGVKYRLNVTTDNVPFIGVDNGETPADIAACSTIEDITEDVPCAGGGTNAAIYFVNGVSAPFGSWLSAHLTYLTIVEFALTPNSVTGQVTNSSNTAELHLLSPNENLTIVIPACTPYTIRL